MATAEEKARMAFLYTQDDRPDLDLKKLAPLLALSESQAWGEILGLDLLGIINRMGKMLKEGRRGRNQRGAGVRKAVSKPGRAGNTVPKMQGRAGSKRKGA